MKLTKHSQITVHGRKDWFPTHGEFFEMMYNVQCGVSQDCNVTIDGVTKTMVEWQMEWQEHLENLEREIEEQVKNELGVTHWSN